MVSFSETLKGFVGNVGKFLVPSKSSGGNEPNGEIQLGDTKLRDNAFGKKLKRSKKLKSQMRSKKLKKRSKKIKKIKKI